jgi:hypothetical protein
MSTQSSRDLIESLDGYTPRQSQLTTSSPYEYSNDNGRLIGRTRPRHRHATVVGVPPTFLHSASHEVLTFVRTEITIFIYDREQYEEPSFRSIGDIRAVQNNQCLWIQVIGVSEYASFYPIQIKINLSL